MAETGLGITRARATGSSFPSSFRGGRSLSARFPGSVTYRAIEQLLAASLAHRSAAPFFLKATLSCPPKSVPSSGLPLTKATSHESPSVPTSASCLSHESLPVTLSVASPQAPLVASPAPQASHEKRSTRHLPNRVYGNARFPAGEASAKATAGTASGARKNLCVCLENLVNPTGHRVALEKFPSVAVVKERPCKRESEERAV